MFLPKPHPHPLLLLLIGLLCLWVVLTPPTTFAQEDSDLTDPTTTEPECSGLYFPITSNETPSDGAQPERLIAPPLPENPTQLDCGAYQFAQICMACHGDQGQGLTEEWRAAWGTEEMDCWQSGCHAKNHPPEGFEFPTYAPQLIGNGALGRFETAADLHNYISTKMPWHAPGTLDEKTYWQLVTFLATRNGVEVTEYLTPENAPRVRLRPLPPPQPVDSITATAPDETPIFPFAVFYVALTTVLTAGVALGVYSIRR
jgi:mono/diheme cytochrome c family protein